MTLFVYAISPVASSLSLPCAVVSVGIADRGQERDCWWFGLLFVALGVALVVALGVACCSMEELT